MTATPTEPPGPVEAPAEPAEDVAAPDGSVEVSARAILFGSGPRFARDGFGPVLAFYVGWKVGGLVLGIATATAVSLTGYYLERRQDRPGLLARLMLGVVVLQAVIGLLADDAKVYLAQPVLISGLWGLAFVGSTLIGRPLCGAFAGEMYPFPPEVRASATFRQVFGRVSLAWGAFMLARCAFRLATLAGTSVEGFLVVNFVTGFPLMAALMSWSVWYSMRSFKRSEEWGWALA